jgi:hypothetical protein
MPNLSIKNIGPAPCIGCRYSYTCRTEELACSRFEQWVQTGKATGDETPRYDTYLRLFGSDHLGPSVNEPELELEEYEVNPTVTARVLYL